ncbi:MAG: Mbeg1-like protein [Pseudomonadota bacterium]|nr:Mbeg1-like protein [Pseudomonadota bacterium]
MSIGGTNEVSRGSEGLGASQAQSRSNDLAAAGASRVEAAQRALETGGIGTGPSAQITQVQGEVAGAQPQVELAQLNNTAPPPPSTLELAQMSQAAYGQVGPPQGWTQASAQQLAEIGLTPAMLSSPTSEFRAEVYVQEINGQTSYTVAFRGSTATRSDWVANGQQAVGLQTDHYNRALELGESLIVPEGSRVTITGHSLGGGLASAAAIAAEMDATTFNAAGLHSNTIDAAQTIAAADGQLDIPDISAVYVRGDLLSMLQDGGDQMIGGFIGRGLGSWLGGPVGGAAGGLAGQQLTDAPEAYGTRVELDPVRPEGMRWYQDHPVARHGIDYVISSLQGN